MYGTFITLPDSFASSTLGVAGPIISDLSPYLYLVIGVLLAVSVIAVLVTVIRGR